MFQISKTVTALLAGASICWAITASVCTASQSASATLTSPFTPIQEARIGKLAADYLIANPEILEQVSVKLQRQRQTQQVKTMTDAVLSYQSELLDDKDTPTYGPADARVVVTEFFDYQCIYCSQLAPVIEQVIKANPQVRFMFREWPIFGSRWPASDVAARTGLQIWKQKGAKAYLAYHNRLFATGHNEGKLTLTDIHHIATGVKFDKSKAHDVKGVLHSTNILAQQLGFRGTPGLVVMPATKATIETTTVIPGVTDASALQMAINKATGQ